MAGVCKLGAVWSLDLDLPETLVGIPICAGNLVLQFDIFDQAVLVDNIPEILPDLGGLGIILRPIRVSLPRELIRRRGDVTGTAWVSIQRPRSVWTCEESNCVKPREGQRTRTRTITHLFSSHVPPTSLFFS